MKQINKITAAALSIIIAGVSTVPAFAETVPSEKEEVIYIMTDASGKITDMEAVNIFAGGIVTDYGEYSAVKMLNTTDKLVQSGNKITFSSSADKVYYQGTMKNTVIPWNISIRYFLDGKEYSAEDIAGKSGATVANVGSDKQLTYTILPGKGIDTVIKADVTDFEMDSVAINGVKLNMNIEIDDAELTDKVNEIISAIGELDDGASELRDGTGELRKATGTLNSKVGELHSGVGSLTDGTGELSSGLNDITANNDQLTGAAYTAYEGLCTAAAAALNSQLEANGFSTVTLTPSTYSEVLTGLLKKLDKDAVYQQAYQEAQRQVTQPVNEQADALYLGYVQSQEDSIYLAYITSQADTLYTQVAAQALYEQLVKSGFSEEQAGAFLQSAEGQDAVAQAASALTEEQKSQILNGAVSQLTDEQKAQILQSAVDSLTKEQKKQIRDGYIQQMMASDEVTSQLNAAAAAVSDAAKQVSELKGQLDSYGVFYQGLVDYTGAVSDAAAGAKELKLNMDTLYDNTGTLETSVGELNDAVRELYSGTKQLSDGTSEFKDKTSDMDIQISDEIDSITASVSGGDSEVVSFVSDKNTNVDSVQFVIKTDSIEVPEVTVEDSAEEETLNFWQKLLRLFGLY